MLKWLKLLIAIILLPVCAGTAIALWQIVLACGSVDTTWVPFFGGVVCWLVIFMILPKPIWIYVLGHELTHALWAWMFGGQVKKMKVSSSGGHVVISKTNFLITLAPYFFPLYAALVIGVFALGHWLWDWQRFFVYFHLLLGMAYAFHVTLTVYTLRTRQSDITSQGYLFSAVIIFLGNVAVLLFGIPLLTERVSVVQAAKTFFWDTNDVFLWLRNLI